MARPRKPFAYFTPTITRTLERVAIAALAAIATRGHDEGGVAAALIIFVIVAVVEELGRGWVAHGKRISLRELAYGGIADRSLRSHGGGAGNKARRRRSATRRAHDQVDPGSGDVARRKV